jgi:hypothetical protein
MQEFEKFYSTHSIITDPDNYGQLFDRLPNDIPSICRIVQGLFVHMFLTETYGVKLSDERREELNLRCISRQIKSILQLDNLDLSITREPKKRLFGCCRDFATFTTAILRHKGIPARIRHGYADYLPPLNHYEAHVICQYWNTDQMRWITLDTQIDDLQRKLFNINFNTQDIQNGKFLSGGRAWQMCRNKKAEPAKFGISTHFGLGHIRYSLILDMLGLNKIELVPGDSWNLMPKDAREGFSTEEEAFYFDRLAAITEGDEPDFLEVTSLFQKFPELQPEANWKP